MSRCRIILSFLAGILGCLAIVIIFKIELFKHKNQSYSVAVGSQSTDFNALQKWSRSVPSLKFEDFQRIELLLSREAQTVDEIRDQFYHVVNTPLQTTCSVGKYFGGYWMTACGGMDGNKYVCLDQFYNDIVSKSCLIYSFGVSGDWSFEESMAALGCSIRAFDPTISGEGKPSSDLISFQKTGLGVVSGEIEGIGPVLTLKDTVDAMGDSSKIISYLKVDIEGAELKAIPEWISSGVLSQVSQIGIELHTQPTGMSKAELATLLGDLLDAMRKLNEMGFKLISLFNNECGGKSGDYEGKYLVYFEVVFYRVL